MLFLRALVILICILIALIYLVSLRIREEYFQNSGQSPGFFQWYQPQFKAFRHNPPTPEVARLLKLHRKLSLVMLAALVAFGLAILAAALVET